MSDESLRRALLELRSKQGPTMSAGQRLGSFGRGFAAGLTGPLAFAGLNVEPGQRGFSELSGEVAGGLIPYILPEMGAAALAERFPVAAGGALIPRTLRTMATFAAIEAGRTPKGQPVDPEKLIPSALEGLIFGVGMSPGAGVVRQGITAAAASVVPTAMGQEVHAPVKITGNETLDTATFNTLLASLFGFIGGRAHMEAPLESSLPPIPPPPSGVPPPPIVPPPILLGPGVEPLVTPRPVEFRDTPPAAPPSRPEPPRPEPTMARPTPIPGDLDAVQRQLNEIHALLNPEPTLPPLPEGMEPRPMRAVAAGERLGRMELEALSQEANRQDTLIGREQGSPQTVYVDLGSGFGEEVKGSHIGIESRDLPDPTKDIPNFTSRRRPQIKYDLGSGSLPFERASVDGFNASEILNALPEEPRQVIYKSLDASLRRGGIVSIVDEPRIVEEAVKELGYDIIEKSGAGVDVADKRLVSVLLRKPLGGAAEEAIVPPEVKWKPTIIQRKSMSAEAAIEAHLERSNPKVGEKGRPIAVHPETAELFRGFTPEEVPGFDGVQIQTRGLSLTELRRLRYLAASSGDRELQRTLGKVIGGLIGRKTIKIPPAFREPKPREVRLASDYGVDAAVESIEDQLTNELFGVEDPEVRVAVKTRKSSLTTMMQMRAPEEAPIASYGDGIRLLRAHNIIPVEGGFIMPDKSFRPMKHIDEMGELLASVTKPTEAVPVYAGPDSPPLEEPIANVPAIWQQRMLEPVGEHFYMPEATADVVVKAERDTLPEFQIARTGEFSPERGGTLFFEGEYAYFTDFEEFGGKRKNMFGRVKGRALDVTQESTGSATPFTVDRDGIKAFLEKYRPKELAAINEEFGGPPVADWSGEKSLEYEQATDKLFGSEVIKQGYDFARIIPTESITGEPSIIFVPNESRHLIEIESVTDPHKIGPGTGEGPGAQKVSPFGRRVETTPEERAEINRLNKLGEERGISIAKVTPDPDVTIDQLTYVDPAIRHLWFEPQYSVYDPEHGPINFAVSEGLGQVEKYIKGEIKPPKFRADETVRFKGPGTGEGPGAMKARGAERRAISRGGRRQIDEVLKNIEQDPNYTPSADVLNEYPEVARHFERVSKLRSQLMVSSAVHDMLPPAAKMDHVVSEAKAKLIEVRRGVGDEILLENVVTGETTSVKGTKAAIEEVAKSLNGVGDTYTEEEWKSIFRRGFAGARDARHRANIRNKYKLFSRYFPAAGEALRPGETKLSTLRNHIKNPKAPPILNLTPPGAPPIGGPPGMHPVPPSAGEPPISWADLLKHDNWLGVLSFSHRWRSFFNWAKDIEYRTKGLVPAFKVFMAVHPRKLEYDAWIAPYLEEMGPYIRGTRGRRGAGVRIGQLIERGEGVAKEIGANNAEIAAARKMHELFNRLWADPKSAFVDIEGKPIQGVDFIRNFIPHRRAHGEMSVGQVNEKFYGGRLSQQTTKFLSDLERSGVDFADRELNAYKLYLQYVRQLGYHRILKGSVNDAIDMVQKMTLPQGYEDIRKRMYMYLSDVKGVPDSSIMAANKAVRNILQRMGVRLSEEDNQNYVSMLLQLSVGAHLGWRIPSLVRNSFQIGFAYPFLGERYFGVGIKAALTKAGWNEALHDGIFQASTGHLPFFDEIYNPMSKLSDLVQKGTKAYGAIDDFTRVVGHLGMKRKFMDAALSFQQGKINLAELVKRAELTSVFHPIEADTLINMVRSGRIDEAARTAGFYMQANTNWIYAAGNAPSMFRGVAGRLFGQFGIWPAHYIDYIKYLGRFGTPLERATKMARFSALNAAFVGAGAYFGVNTLKWVFYGPLVFTGGPFLSIAQDIASVAEAKSQGYDSVESKLAMKRLMRDLPGSLVPGMGLARDLTKMYKAAREDGPTAATVTMLTGQIPTKPPEPFLAETPRRLAPPAAPPADRRMQDLLRELRSRR